MRIEAVSSCELKLYHHANWSCIITLVEPVSSRELNLYHHASWRCIITRFEAVSSCELKLYHHAIWSCIIMRVEALSSREMKLYHHACWTCIIMLVEPVSSRELNLYHASWTCIITRVEPVSHRELKLYQHTRWSSINNSSWRASREPRANHWQNIASLTGDGIDMALWLACLKLYVVSVFLRSVSAKHAGGAVCSYVKHWTLRCGAIPLRVVANMVSCVIDATGGNCSSKTDYG